MLIFQMVGTIALAQPFLNQTISYGRDWRNYTPLKYEIEFAQTDWNIDCVDVQQYWNLFENKVIRIVDTVSPMVKFSNDT